MKALVAAFALAVASPAAAAGLTAQDEAALRTLAARGDAVWDAKDPAGMASLYDADATLLVGGASNMLTGRRAIAEYFDRAFAARQGALRHVTRLTAMNALSPDVVVNDALVDVEARRDGAWTVVRSFNNISIAERGPEGWRLKVVRAFPTAQPNVAK